MAWGHFAEGFVDTYIEGKRQEEKEAKDRLLIKAQRWKDGEDSYNKQKSEDQKLVDQAKAIVEAETLAPKGSEFSIYQALKSGQSVDMILTDIRRSGADAWEDFIPKPPENTGGIIPEDTQTQEILGGDTTVFNPDSKAGADPSILETTQNLTDPRPELSAEDEELRELLGVDADYFSMIRQGYTSGGDLKRNYTFNRKPEAKKGPATAEAAALEIYRNSDEFLTMNSKEQVEALKEFKEMFTAKKSGKESTTYTMSNYNNDLIKYQSMLLSDDPEEVAEAQSWMKVKKPLIESVLASTSSLNSGPEDSMIISYTNDEGNTVVSSGKLDQNGNAKLDTGSVIQKSKVKNVQTPAMADAANKSLNSASTVYTEAGKVQTAALIASEGLYNLEQIVLKNEDALTLTGKGTSAFDSLRTEFIAAGNLLFDLQDKDPEADSETLLSKLNAEVQDKVDGNFIGYSSMTEEQGKVYKEFNAALVRAVFATGKALGQTGNGFSNKDYDNIMKSLKNSNSYEAFSQNLRNFSKEMMTNWESTVSTSNRNPLVQSARQYPSNAGYLDGYMMTPDKYYASEAGSSKAHIFEWANSKPSAQNAQRRIIDSAGDDQIKAGMSPDLRGKRVLQVITKNTDGTLSVEFTEAK